jgi:dihydrofolate reductase
MVILSLLVAADENNVIGKDNRLPWCLPSDLKYFKNKTWGMAVLMGRKTFQSIGKPLPGRKSIVITHNKEWKQDKVEVVYSINAAIQKAIEFGVKEIIVIGGAEIFKSIFPQAGRIYLTRIHHQFNGDVYFPQISEKEWDLVQNKFCQVDEKNPYSHTFQVWERKSKF